MSKINRGFFVALTTACAVSAPFSAQAVVPAIYNLGTLGGSESFGYAVNAGGQVGGYSSTFSSFTHRAFLYSGTPGSGGSMANLGTLGGPESFGYAVNAGGQVTGYADTLSGDRHAFVYSGMPG